MEKYVKDELYYHGFLPREDMKAMLIKKGDWLIRISEPKAGDAKTLILSVMYNEENEEIKHFIIRFTFGKFCVEKYSFDTIPKMIEYYQRDKKTTDIELTLRNAILRQHWELAHDDIEIVKKLGEGAYGEVMMGKLKVKRGGDFTKVNVAIKQAKLESLTKEQVKEVMREARLMRNFDHPNIVKFYGVAAGIEPLMVVMELVDCGALDSYLQKHPQDLKKKNEMCAQAAFGLEYMHSKNMIHRDIAARNCLYGNEQVKISDFGLTREGPSYQMNPHRRVPIRWLSPEVMKTQLYTFKSDIWAFGILMWEIYANGTEPYPGMMVAEVHRNVLRDNYRMDKPDVCPYDIWTYVVNALWANEPEARPEISQVVKQMEQYSGLIKPPLVSSTDMQTAVINRSKKSKAIKKKK